MSSVLDALGDEAAGTPATATTAPLAISERVRSIDVLRGVAVLGILLMNITGFALPFSASFDPSVAGGASGASLWVWAVNAVLFEGKMRAIFSMLFGAGLIVLTSRLEQRGAGIETADICLRRLLWLIAFGLVHAYFIWWGDILFFYGVVGLFLFPLRNLPARALVTAGIVLLSIHCLRGQLNALDTERVRTAALEADRAAAAGAVLTGEQKEAQGAWARRLEEARPSQEALNKDLAAYRGGFGEVLRTRAGFVAMSQAPALYHFFFLDAGGMMLLGMGLFKLRFFSASLPARHYWTAALVGCGVGLPLAALAAQHDIASGFDPVTMAFGQVLGAAARVPIAIALVAVVMLVYRAGILTWLTSRLGGVGQMAFTNYIAQSLICTTLFYGYGFGLYGHLQRYQLYYVVLGVWTVQLLVSPIWLRRFRFGPLEWAWRSLTYMQRQPMRLAGAAGWREREP